MSPFWKEALSHETYDAFWKARNLRPQSEKHQTGRADRRWLV